MSIGLIVCDDLIFTSKVTTTARAKGLAMKIAKSQAQALTMLDGVSAIIIDLHTSDLVITDFVLTVGVPVIGFGSHVDTATLKNARAAGCKLVMPRSQFVKELEGQLEEWLMVN